MMASAGLLVLMLLGAPRAVAGAPALRPISAATSAFRSVGVFPIRAGGRALAAASDETPPPAPGDRDRERILRLQSSLKEIVRAAFGRLKVGLRVVEAHTGRVFFGKGATSLMDPASNQKVLATTTALVRLGSDWRFRTEVYGAAPDDEGVVQGDLFLRGSGDPTLGARELEELANKLVARGVRRVTGGIVADPRRLGDDGPVTSDDQRPQLTINRGLVVVRVHPSDVGDAPSVILDPPPPRGQVGGPSDFVVVNQARTAEGRQRHLSIDANAARGVLRIDVAGRIGSESPGVLFRRRLPDGALTTAIFFRAALAGAGVPVGERATLGLVGADAELLVAHSSAPLGVLLRRINKDSDNYEAERLLEAVGAEVLGGPATTDKGIAVLRDVISEFGLDPRSYLPKNGSGLGHANRISARAMTDLLRALYLDPRVGPELLQSLSVGGVDGTTRNRFRGLPVARHVRAKTGTLVGKSCLSGLVGDGDDVMAFSIMVQGFKSRRALSAVRGAQVAAVNMMMRYTQERGGSRVEPPPAIDIEPGGVDYETGGEMESTEDEVPDAPPVAAAVPEKRPVLPAEEPRPGTPVSRKVAVRTPDASVKATAPARAPAQPKTRPVAEESNEAEAPEEETPGTPETPETSAPLGASFGLGGLGSIAGGDAAPGARLFCDFGGPMLGIEAAVYGTTYHAMAGPAPGNTDWTRIAGMVGPRFRMKNRQFVLDLKAAVGAGYFLVQGRNYPVNASNTLWALGAGAGARLSLDRGVMSPWLALDAVAWPGHHPIEIRDPKTGMITATSDIPAMDVLVSLGFTLRLW
jgi:PBP4 family serine-type D-alanyl-D-alanine carboxypeptidase